MFADASLPCNKDRLLSTRMIPMVRSNGKESKYCIWSLEARGGDEVTARIKEGVPTYKLEM